MGRRNGEPQLESDDAQDIRKAAECYRCNVEIAGYRGQECGRKGNSDESVVLRAREAERARERHDVERS